MKTQPLKDRFWDKVIKTDSCWLWIGYIGKRGYGDFRINKKTYRAHRVSYVINIGPIPDNLCVLHKCDNRRCIRPDHLWLGTVLDNQKDMSQKKRGKNAYMVGKRAGNIRLTEQQILAIREEFKQGQSKPFLAEKYKVVRQNIHRIITRKSWKHI